MTRCRANVSEALLLTGAEDCEVFTTGAWYWRLARVLTRPGRDAPSRALGQAPRTTSAGCLTPWTIDPEALRAIGIDFDEVRAAVEETFGVGALEAAQIDVLLSASNTSRHLPLKRSDPSS